jgi:hypothetical protein
VDSTNIQSKYEEYVAKFGVDNAAYLIEVIGAWQNHDNRAAYIDLGIGDGTRLEGQTQQEAANRGWPFERLTGNLTLIRRLLDGEWDRDFLVSQPGQQIAMSYDEDVINEDVINEDVINEDVIVCRTHQ